MRPDLSARREALAAALAELRCTALVVYGESASDPDLAPFVGDARLGAALVAVSREGDTRLSCLATQELEAAAATGLALSTPEDLDLAHGQCWPDPAAELAHVLRRSLALAGIEPGRVALAGHGPAGLVWGAAAEFSKEGWAWVPGNPLVQQVRKTKTAGELAAIRRVAAGACSAMRGVAGLLAAAEVRRHDAGPEVWLGGAPLTVARVRREIGCILSEAGLEQPLGSLVAPGVEGAAPHTAGTPDRVLRPGESLVVDLFPKGTLFADCTRTFCVGPPPEPLARAFAALEKALAVAHAGARPGVRGWDLHEAVCRSLDVEGYDTPIFHPGSTVGYLHHLGHGVGFELHQLPTFRKASGAEGVLRTGDVFALEPGLYDAGAGYAVRLEDLCALTPDGLENLTPLPYALDPRAW